MLKVGQVVQYKLSPQDIECLELMRLHRGAQPGNPQILSANPHTVGQVVPAIVVWPHDNLEQSFNGQAVIDGNFTLWLTSVPAGFDPGQWQTMDEA